MLLETKYRKFVYSIFAHQRIPNQTYVIETSNIYFYVTVVMVIHIHPRAIVGTSLQLLDESSRTSWTGVILSDNKTHD